MNIAVCIFIGVILGLIAGHFACTKQGVEDFKRLSDAKDDLKKSIIKALTN